MEKNEMENPESFEAEFCRMELFLKKNFSIDLISLLSPIVPYCLSLRPLFGVEWGQPKY
jgi:hypothetical protein